ncbi:MAG: hypothetical protein J4452_04815 [Candidatus Aenigmarchaeota archaeon]|nr:hypothetical protein [Candidatus Aenigmarchaeota archaeon]
MQSKFDAIKTHLKDGITLDNAKKYARDFVYGFPSVWGTTIFSPITVAIELIDASRMKDKRLSLVNRMNWAAYCRFTYGINPHQTYDEFIRQYDGKTRLTTFLENKLKNERKPREYPFYEPDSHIFH